MCVAVEQRPPGHTVRDGEILVDTVKRDADLQAQAAAAAAAAGAPVHFIALLHQRHFDQAAATPTVCHAAADAC